MSSAIPAQATAPSVDSQGASSFQSAAAQEIGPRQATAPAVASVQVAPAVAVVAPPSPAPCSSILLETHTASHGKEVMWKIDGLIQPDSKYDDHRVYWQSACLSPGVHSLKLANSVGEEGWHGARIIIKQGGVAMGEETLQAGSRFKELHFNIELDEGEDAADGGASKRR